ncbi:hypothetical protein A2803_02985 [Candidatus Woesebacteria bacterium RIFCSPHIGHO2_01_FULL_44_21]|uniref:Uncharacterized protein n=1 Tax=Candidatus Woesebacteria bacterium RIFCSPHIGHO2_01_FULL_44_21 TaxID=1802503 RepID=A0A1F7Z0K0_9BACT|nr:MAG: hypothetical protein A2803_02985 [Candidatus Woesebacteria bacterium RIFCSPHIGHO2_01_FULL_44_21]OGM69220.1 MAG: hypothetical protein A2897_04395 [Candidatus Woesebacteria bacterium RIFCSPLOWO2_01_FULL_44_24b]
MENEKNIVQTTKSDIIELRIQQFVEKHGWPEEVARKVMTESEPLLQIPVLKVDQQMRYT